MSAHTPGPWEWVGKSLEARDGYVLEIGDDGKPWGMHSTTVEITDADARLIAAAPDMFDALQDALASLEISGQSDYVTGRVRDAIAKARGAA